MRRHARAETNDAAEQCTLYGLVGLQGRAWQCPPLWSLLENWLPKRQAECALDEYKRMWKGMKGSGMVFSSAVFNPACNVS